MKTALKLVDNGLVPLPLLKFGVRRLLAQRLVDEASRPTSTTESWLREMESGPVADVPEKANEQHYEVPPGFFLKSLGPHLKYSSCYFEKGDEDLGTAEARMLELTCERAQLEDGQAVLEMGCGWGSLTLWMAARYPNSTITGVSNSAPQRKFILECARERGLSNIEIITADMNAFDALQGRPDGFRYDRIVSVEMFEHMRNWSELLGRARGWLSDAGRMFIHVFTHKSLNYPFEVRDDTDWMSKYFFSGGMMPADGLLPALTQRDSLPFSVEQHDVVNGRHYSRTAKLWRENLENRKGAAMPVLRDTYGASAGTWFQRWRIFFLACEELFGFRDGSEWAVSHYRLAPTTVDAANASSAESDGRIGQEVIN